MTKCVDAELYSKFRRNNPPVTTVQGDLTTVELENIRINQLHTLRLEWLRYNMGSGVPGHEWMEKCIQKTHHAKLEHMNWEDWVCLKFIEGTKNGKKLRDKSIEMEDKNIKAMQRRALKYARDEQISERGTDGKSDVLVRKADSTKEEQSGQSGKGQSSRDRDKNKN